MVPHWCVYRPQLENLVERRVAPTVCVQDERLLSEDRALLLRSLMEIYVRVWVYILQAFISYLLFLVFAQRAALKARDDDAKRLSPRRVRATAVAPAGSRDDALSILTSRGLAPVVANEIDRISATIVGSFIAPWHDRVVLCEPAEFPGRVHTALARVLGDLGDRMSRVSWLLFALEDGSTALRQSVTTGAPLHAAVTGGGTAELAHERAVASALVNSLLPAAGEAPDALGSVLLTEIVAARVVRPLIRALARPETLNAAICFFLLEPAVTATNGNALVDAPAETGSSAMSDAESADRGLITAPNTIKPPADAPAEPPTDAPAELPADVSAELPANAQPTAQLPAASTAIDASAAEPARGAAEPQPASIWSAFSWRPRARTADAMAEVATVGGADEISAAAEGTASASDESASATVADGVGAAPTQCRLSRAALLTAEATSFALLEEIFALKSRSWLTRNAIATIRVVLQVFFMGAAERAIAAAVDAATTPVAVAAALSKLRNHALPSKEAAAAKESSPATANDSRAPASPASARAALLRSAPPSLVTVLGRDATEASLGAFFDALQDPLRLRSIAWTLMDAAVDRLVNEPVQNTPPSAPQSTIPNAGAVCEPDVVPTGVPAVVPAVVHAVAPAVVSNVVPAVASAVVPTVVADTSSPSDETECEAAAQPVTEANVPPTPPRSSAPPRSASSPARTSSSKEPNLRPFPRSSSPTPSLGSPSEPVLPPSAVVRSSTFFNFFARVPGGSPAPAPPPTSIATSSASWFPQKLTTTAAPSVNDQSGGATEPAPEPQPNEEPEGARTEHPCVPVPPGGSPPPLPTLSRNVDMGHWLGFKLGKAAAMPSSNASTSGDARANTSTE